MKKVPSLLIAVCLAVACGGAQAADCFVDGSKWEEWNSAPENLGQVMQIGFTRGFVDTMVLWHRNAGINPSWVATCVVPMPVNDVRGIIDKYVKDHPKNRKACMADLALAALSEACSKSQ